MSQLKLRTGLLLSESDGVWFRLTIYGRKELGILGSIEMLGFWVFLCFYFIATFTAFADIILKSNNVTLSFEDIEATFAPWVEGSGEHGLLYVADPLDACSKLTNKNFPKMDTKKSPFVLIIRGGCSFDIKVRRAQDAGFEAAIVYDDMENADLVAMAGNPVGINIYALFVSKDSGETLARYAGSTDTVLWIIPNFEESSWSIMIISFISLLAMSAVLAACFFVRRHRIRREHPQAPRIREFHGMSSRLVKAMPSLIFTAVLEDNSTSSTCAICLEEYNIGDKIRILPCRHKFHAMCVDAWLTSWRTFCPVCKRDARTNCGEPPASESTPLLSSSPLLISSSGIAPARSSAMQINPSHSQSSSLQCPLSTPTPRSHHRSLHSPYQSTHLSTARSFTDLRNMSSHTSQGSYIISPHSFGYPSLSSLNSRYMIPYIPSPSEASSSGQVGSSSDQADVLHYSDSSASI